MKPSIFLKTITLLFFVSCIITFLLYRTGNFDNYLNAETPSLQTSSNGGTIKLTKADSSKIFQSDSTQMLRMSSSKVIIMTDFVRKRFDSAAQKRKRDSVITSIMYGSKSGQIFTPKKPTTNRKETYLLSSSKSIQVVQSLPILIQNPDSVNAAIFKTKKKTN